MKPTKPSLTKSSVSITAPCEAKWSEMHGDDATRFCSGCAKNVHFISAMQVADAVALVETGADLCVRYAYRSDGTIRFADEASELASSEEAARAPQDQLARQRSGARSLLSAAAIALVFAGVTAYGPEARADAGESPLAGEGSHNPWLSDAVDRSRRSEGTAGQDAQRGEDEILVAGNMAPFLTEHREEPRLPAKEQELRNQDEDLAPEQGEPAAGDAGTAGAAHER